MSYDSPDEELPARPAIRKRTVFLSVLAAGGIASGGAYAYAASGTTTGSPSGSAPTSSSSSSSGSSTSKCSSPGSPGDDFDGNITAVSSSSLTVRSLFGTSRTYAISSKTSVHEGPQTSVKVSSLSNGEHVHVRASLSSSKYTATDIDVHPAAIDGRVTAISSTGLTVSDRDGFTRTIVTDSSTTYTSSGKSASRSSITSGSVVHAQGQVDANGTSLDADSVAEVTATSGPDGLRPGRGARPAGPPAGCGPMGGPGGPGGQRHRGGAAPSGAPKPPSGSSTKSSTKSPTTSPSSSPSSTPSSAGSS